MVLAHTTDLRRPFLCQPCPALRLLSASEIPRERRIIVGLSPLNLPRKPERLMEQVRSAGTVLCCRVHTRKPHTPPCRGAGPRGPAAGSPLAPGRQQGPAAGREGGHEQPLAVRPGTSTPPLWRRCPQEVPADLPKARPWTDSSQSAPSHQAPEALHGRACPSAIPGQVLPLLVPSLPPPDPAPLSSRRAALGTAHHRPDGQTVRNDAFRGPAWELVLSCLNWIT